MEWFLSAAAVLSGLLYAAVTVWGGYYLMISLMSWRRPAGYDWRPARTRFAVLIAARNEELVIGQLISSLRTQDYPEELYDIWVIPNHCSDNTALAAKNAGARVLECTVPVNSKGEVLRFAYNRLRGRRYDAYCVFDADNLVDRRFLSEMNNAYQAGVRVAQGYRDSKNPWDTAVSCCYSIYYWMMNRLFNAGKAGLGLSAMVNGTGFMISAGVLEKLGGWHTQTISEDLEITVQCVLAGEKIHWIPRAVTYDEQPLSYAQSAKQRRRWSSGTIQVAEDYLGKVGAAFCKGNRSLALVDLSATLLIPAYQTAALCNVLLSALKACLDCGALSQGLLGLLNVMLMNLFLIIFGPTLAAALVLTVENKWDRRLIKGLLTYWLFLLSWLPITIESFVKKTTQWEEIRHTRNIAPKDFAKGRALAP